MQFDLLMVTNVHVADTHTHTHTQTANLVISINNNEAGECRSEDNRRIFHQHYNTINDTKITVG